MTVLTRHPHPQRLPEPLWQGVRLVPGLLALVALAVFLARAPLLWCVALLLGGVALVALLLRPAWGLYALAFAVPFGSLRPLPLGGVTLGLTDLIVFASIGAWLLRLAATRRGRLIGGCQLAALLLFVGALLISLWPAQALVPALTELAKWLEVAAVFLLVASEMRPGEVDLLVAALLLAGTLQGLLGIYQFVNGVGPEAFTLRGRYMRAYGTFGQPNPFGGYMGLLLPLAYGMALTRWGELRSAWRRRQPRGALVWALAAGATVVMGLALGMSWSRGALLGLVAGLALVVMASSRRRWPLLLGGAAVLVLFAPQWTALLPSGYLSRLTDTMQYLGVADLSAVEVTDDNFAVIERAAHWLAAWRMFSLAPWIGVGTGQYATVYPAVALGRWTDPLGHAHNFYLNILAEGGLVGLASYLLFLGVALAAAFRQTWRSTGWRQGLALGALGMLGHLAAHSLVDNLYVQGMYLIVAILLGLVASLARGPLCQDASETAPVRS